MVIFRTIFDHISATWIFLERIFTGHFQRERPFWPGFLGSLKGTAGLPLFTMSFQHCSWYFIYDFTTQKGVILPKIIYFQSQKCWCCKLPRGLFISPILRLISLNFALPFISIGVRIYDSHFPYIWGLCIYLKCVD